MSLITFLPNFRFDRRTVRQGQVLVLNCRYRHLGVGTGDSLPVRVSLPGCKAEGTIRSPLRLLTAAPSLVANRLDLITFRFSLPRS
jgi:hypothetical protein